MVKMIITDHQIGYLPWVGLFQRMTLIDVFVSLDIVKFNPRTFDSRNRIRTKTGWVWLKVPIKNKNSVLKDTEINNEIDWQRGHWETLKRNYAKSPFFDEYFDFFDDVYSRKWKKLTELNEHIVKFVMKDLGVGVKWLKASELDLAGTGNQLIINECKKLNADMYVFGGEGESYANKEAFRKEGIKLYFHYYNHPTYKQRFEGFEPFMSVIDLMFNHGKKRSYEIIMENNPTKEDLIKIMQKDFS